MPIKRATKIAICGRSPESKQEIKKAVLKHAFVYSEKKPDLVISYGGDGTFLRAERKYPEVPKILFRYRSICAKCHNLPIDHALERIKHKQYKIKTHNKLIAKIGKQTLIAANDIIIRNKKITEAIRFTLTINRKKSDVYIGDGIVAATTFGSTGYFKSITRKTFSKGIGIAFNNTTTEQPPAFLPEKAKITFTLLRGHALLGADNNSKTITIKKERKITIKQSPKKTKVILFR